jgi:hypothetical protein
MQELKIIVNKYGYVKEIYLTIRYDISTIGKEDISKHNGIETFVVFICLNETATKTSFPELTGKLWKRYYVCRQ